MDDNSLTNYTDAVGSLSGAASGILGALRGNKSSAPAPAAASKAAPTNWGLIAGIGAAVLVVLVLVVSMGGRR